MKRYSAIAVFLCCAAVGAIALYGITHSPAVAGSHEEAADQATENDEQKVEEKPGLPEAPAWTLTDAHGNEHQLSDFRGKYVVMEWVNYGCPFVRKFYQPGQMQKWQDHYTERGIVWLQICSSNVGKQGYYTPEQWIEQNEQRNVNVPVLLDTDGKVGRAYGATRTPEFAIINPDGKWIYHGAIDSIRSTNPEDIEKADNYVQKVLDAALLDRTEPYGCTIKY